MREPYKLNPKKVRRLLDKLCTELGICDLPDDVVQQLVFNPPLDVEAFIELVFAGEGLDAKFRGPVYRQVKDRVAELYSK